MDIHGDIRGFLEIHVWMDMLWVLGPGSTTFCLTLVASSGKARRENPMESEFFFFRLPP